MKILYAIQGTGNGHLSRAVQLYPYLLKYGEVDFFLSGANNQLNLDIPIKYRSKGVSLYYKKTGGLDYLKILGALSLNLFKEAKNLPVQSYDLVINDFEFLTSLACSMKKIPSIHFGHQASFQSQNTPRAKSLNPMGNFILENFVQSKRYIGLHFESYDQDIYNPIIKEDIISATPTNNGHIAVYLPQYAIQYLQPFLLEKKQHQFEIFTNEVNQIEKKENLTFMPINNKEFSKSMISCYAIITAGGFETPAEAMYLNKKVLSIPIHQHYEQQCNALALKQLGIKTLTKIGTDFSNEFDLWDKEFSPVKLHLKNSTGDIVNKLFN